jgi:hypothetical protein
VSRVPSRAAVPNKLESLQLIRESGAIGWEDNVVADGGLAEVAAKAGHQTRVLLADALCWSCQGLVPVSLH